MNHSAVIYDYLRRLKQDPGSKVFAPLAEIYRKNGMLKEAVEVATEGMRYHPDFFGGRVALARALFDLHRFSEVITTLKESAKDAPENLAAQRLLGDSYLMLKDIPSALRHYKLLLTASPQDQATSRLVQELESSGYQQGWLKIHTEVESEEPYPEIMPVQDALSHSEESKRLNWSIRVQTLQDLLQKVERYRHQA